MEGLVGEVFQCRRGESRSKSRSDFRRWVQLKQANSRADDDISIWNHSQAGDAVGNGDAGEQFRSQKSAHLSVADEADSLRRRVGSDYVSMDIQKVCFRVAERGYDERTICSSNSTCSGVGDQQIVATWWNTPN